MDYIEREAAIALWEKDTERGRTEFDQVLMLMPSADVKPVVHGKWVESSIPCEEYVCSVCGGACWYYDCDGVVAKSRYCPNCGADMRGENNG